VFLFGLFFFPLLRVLRLPSQSPSPLSWREQSSLSRLGFLSFASFFFSFRQGHPPSLPIISGISSFSPPFYRWAELASITRPRSSLPGTIRSPLLRLSLISSFFCPPPAPIYFSLTFKSNDSPTSCSGNAFSFRGTDQPLLLCLLILDSPLFLPPCSALIFAPSPLLRFPSLSLTAQRHVYCCPLFPFPTFFLLSSAQRQRLFFVLEMLHEHVFLVRPVASVSFITRRNRVTSLLRHIISFFFSPSTVATDPSIGVGTRAFLPFYVFPSPGFSPPPKCLSTLFDHGLLFSSSLGELAKRPSTCLFDELAAFSRFDKPLFLLPFGLCRDRLLSS